MMTSRNDRILLREITIEERSLCRAIRDQVKLPALQLYRNRAETSRGCEFFKPCSRVYSPRNLEKRIMFRGGFFLPEHRLES